jgi:hypothetical protein
MEVTGTESNDIKEEDLRNKSLQLLSKSKSTHLLIYLDINSTYIPDEEEKTLIEEEKNEAELEAMGFNSSVKEVEDKPTKFVEYAPRIFYQIRKLDGIVSDVLQEAFNPKKNKKAIFKAGESQGKSGSFFFCTHDKHFFIKTMTKSELKILLELLPKYYVHCIKYRNSVIARILGLYKMKLPDMDAMYFFLMENVIQIPTTAELLGMFDLKGSIINREVNEEGKTVDDTLKDCNYRKRTKHNKNVLLSLIVVC